MSLGLARGRTLIPLGNPARDTRRPKCWKRQHFGRLVSHEKNERWLSKHPHVQFHLTPTRSFWLNRVETWFCILQWQSLNGASFTAVQQLPEQIDAFIAA